MFEIEKGIEIPAVNRPGRPCKYPWRTMEIGDSFFAPNREVMGPQVSLASKTYGRKFTSRKVDGGSRVWRIE